MGRPEPVREGRLAHTHDDAVRSLKIQEQQPAGASGRKKDDPGRVHETLGISHAYPNRLYQ